MAANLLWYGQAGYLLSTEKTSFIIDPYFSDSIGGSGFIRLYKSPVDKGEVKVDYALATHNHGDHLDIETLRDYIEFGNFYGPSSCVKAMKAAGFPDQKLHALDRGGQAEIGDIKLSAYYAEHTEDSISVLAECGGIKILFTGDSLFSPKLFAGGPRPDILVVPINGKFGNMTWQEAVLFAHRLKVKTVIPCHYDLFHINSADPDLFAQSFRDSPIRCVILEKNKKVTLGSLL
ncbi:metal-dependent hydrolase [Spirochaetia bacterium]|nr:metal-dependent hydrolase [Spirochaetia bacterium]